MEAKVFYQSGKRRNRLCCWGRLIMLLTAVIFTVLEQRAWSASFSDDLYQKFRVDLPSADVVILLDASGSMVRRYNPVRQATVAFVPTLTDKENLHLRVFSDTVSRPL